MARVRSPRPRIFLGPSVGALNAGFFAAQAHLPAAESVPRALSIWERIEWGRVARCSVRRCEWVHSGSDAGTA